VPVGRLRTVATAALALGVGWSSAAAEVRTGVEIDAGLTAPLDGWRDTTGLGLGGGVRARVPLRGELEVTTRLGATAHVPTRLSRVGVPAERQLVQVPLTFGLRYPISAPGRVRLVLAGEVGVAWSRASVVAAGQREVDAEVVAVGAIALGLEVGRVTVGTSLWLADLVNRDDHVGVVLSLAGTLRRPR
jgi:hypothetical protein